MTPQTGKSFQTFLFNEKKMTFVYIFIWEISLFFASLPYTKYERNRNMEMRNNIQISTEHSENMLRKMGHFGYENFGFQLVHQCAPCSPNLL